MLVYLLRSDTLAPGPTRSHLVCTAAHNPQDVCRYHAGARAAPRRRSQRQAPLRPDRGLQMSRIIRYHREWINRFPRHTASTVSIDCLTSCPSTIYDVRIIFGLQIYRANNLDGVGRDMATTSIASIAESEVHRHRIALKPTWEKSLIQDFAPLSRRSLT